jgi:hypothetical protein
MTVIRLLPKVISPPSIEFYVYKYQRAPGKKEEANKYLTETYINHTYIIGINIKYIVRPDAFYEQRVPQAECVLAGTKFVYTVPGEP